MGSRLLSGGVLVASVLIAWLTVNLWIAARILQLAAAVSLLYVAMLAFQGWRAMRVALRDARSSAGQPTGQAETLPFVSLIIPARNEAGVVAGAVGDLAAQAYRAGVGTPRLELLVVDDGSSDGTGRVAREAAAGLGHVRVVRREPGTGEATKGAVLAWAMPFVRGDVIGVIDADTRVALHFLERAMRAWRRDDRAAGLQVERQARNTGASWLVAAQEEEQLMDMASQCGRWATDGTAELRGNGMFVRRAALERVGGWSSEALTEDLDLSTRLSAAGERVTLAPEATVAEEAVESIGALWNQRMRWAEGSLRRLMEHGPRMLAGPLPLGFKADFLAFTAEFLVPPLFVAAIVVSLVTVILPQPADWTVPASLFVAYGTGSLLLAIAGLAAHGVRGTRLIGRAVRASLFLSHWLFVVPAALSRIALGPGRAPFTPTARVGADD